MRLAGSRPFVDVGLCRFGDTTDGAGNGSGRLHQQVRRGAPAIAIQ
jgi:hypothetical protein